MMASSNSSPGIDMNDPSNLDLYSELLLFKNDHLQDDALWQIPDNTLQRALQSLAHKLDLEYEYSLSTRVARISRTAVPKKQMNSKDGEIETCDISYFNNGNDSAGVDFNILPGLLTNMPTSFGPLGTPVSAPVAVSDPSIMAPEFSNWFNFDAASLSFEPHLSEQRNELQSSYDSLLDFMSTGYELQNSPSQNLDFPAQPLDEGPSTAISGNGTDSSGIDMDDSTASANSSKRKRFSCTSYPPCSRTFARSEHLARHIRVHIEPPFLCHYDQPFINMDNLQAHAKIDHAVKTPLVNSLAATGMVFEQIDNAGPTVPESDAIINNSTRKSFPSYYSMFQSTGVRGSNSKPSASRSGSVSSFQSDRGRNGLKSMFSRRSSTHSRASAGFQEIVFDSNSAHSGSQASGVSGRQGPLDHFAIAAMNAVKRIGACWRCKFLRKSCDVETPCDLCPKGRLRSNWDIVGCKRGDLKSKMHPITMCPNRGPPRVDFWPTNGRGYDLGEAPSNESLQRHIERRDNMLRALDPTENAQIEAILLAPEDLSLTLKVAFYSSKQTSELSPPAQIPLNECILAIAWEFNSTTSSCNVLEFLGNKTLDSLIAFLQSSAIHQAKLESDQLIAQSLICLRNCLEAMSVKEDGFTCLASHRYCPDDACKVQCISNLELSITLYLDELSRVFFKKENLKSRNGYWISAFYSFCIQATVRKILQKLTYDNMILSSSYSVFEPALSASDQYLHLAVNLFIASSGAYDPLTTDYSGIDPEHVSGLKDIILLQKALGGPVSSSAEYLRGIFEIEET